ncbi:hypothetical protein [Dactylosporangium sp. CA-233914]|uniref:hypothetical protein n=1 Tax=Dactylosporangium sp. CA-233914 TaxID=3239934 RepID=UPI003D90A51B
MDLDATFDKQFFHVPVGQVVPQIPAHRDDDHLRWKPEAGERRLRRQPWAWVDRCFTQVCLDLANAQGNGADDTTVAPA